MEGLNCTYFKGELGYMFESLPHAGLRQFARDVLKSGEARVIQISWPTSMYTVPFQLSVYIYASTYIIHFFTTFPITGLFITYNVVASTSWILVLLMFLSQFLSFLQLSLYHYLSHPTRSSRPGSVSPLSHHFLTCFCSVYIIFPFFLW